MINPGIAVNTQVISTNVYLVITILDYYTGECKDTIRGSILAHWAYLSTPEASKNLPNWGQAAEIAFQAIFPQLMVLLILLNIQRLRDLTLSQGIDIQVSRCKI